ncbi:hypothetical protein EPN87_00875 [archaeon]|nr:MAG: hypothetical protein EPN87_00875 [archaeon]
MSFSKPLINDLRKSKARFHIYPSYERPLEERLKPLTDVPSDFENIACNQVDVVVNMNPEGEGDMTKIFSYMIYPNKSVQVNYRGTIDKNGIIEYLGRLGYGPISFFPDRLIRS